MIKLYWLSRRRFSRVFRHSDRAFGRRSAGRKAPRRESIVL